MFPYPRTRLRIWSRETGSAVPSSVSSLILHTQAEYGAYSRDSPNSMLIELKRFLYSQPMIPPKRFDIFPLSGGCSGEGLDACRFLLLKKGQQPLVN